MSRYSQSELSVAQLRTAAYMYTTALCAHCDFQQPGFDRDAFNYITQQARFVRCFAEEVVDFLWVRDVVEIDMHHLQYFFACEPPVYQPYQELWKYCISRMVEENMMPSNAEATIRRLFSGAERQHYLNRLEQTETALRVIQTWASCDHFMGMSRAEAMAQIENKCKEALGRVSELVAIEENSRNPGG